MAGNYKALRFETSTEVKPISYEIILAFDQPLISDSKFGEGKKNIWYGIKEKIDTGENGFNATEHLHAMIELKGYKKDDTFYIKKLKSEKFTYFAISDDGKEWKTMNDINPVQNTTEEMATPVVATKAAPNDATKLNILWNWYESKENKTTVTDNDIPF